MNTEAATIVAPSKSWEATRRERGSTTTPMSREQSDALRAEQAMVVVKTIKDDFDAHNVLEAVDAASAAETYATAVCHLYTQAMDIILVPWYHNALRAAGVLNPAWFAKVGEKISMERRSYTRRLVVFEIGGLRYVGFRYHENSVRSGKATQDELDPEATSFMYAERIPVAIRADLIVQTMRAIPEGNAGKVALAAFDSATALKRKQLTYVANTAALEADAARLAKLRTEAEALASPYPDLLDALALNIEAVNNRILEARKEAFTDTSVRHSSVLITEDHATDMFPKPADGRSCFEIEPGVYDFFVVNPVGTKIGIRMPTGPDFVG